MPSKGRVAETRCGSLRPDQVKVQWAHATMALLLRLTCCNLMVIDFYFRAAPLSSSSLRTASEKGKQWHLNIAKLEGVKEPNKEKETCQTLLAEATVKPSALDGEGISQVIGLSTIQVINF